MRRLLLILLFVTAAVVGGAAGNAWEPSEQSLDNIAGAEVIERGSLETPTIWVKDRYVYIETNKPVTVKIFSILGQLVSQESVPAGTHRLQLSSRGIYILKVGSITRRITL